MCLLIVDFTEFTNSEICFTQPNDTTLTIDDFACWCFGKTLTILRFGPSPKKHKRIITCKENMQSSRKTAGK